MEEEAEIRARRPECDVIRQNCATTIYNTKRATSKADGWRLLPGKMAIHQSKGNGSFGCLAYFVGWCIKDKGKREASCPLGDEEELVRVT